MRNPTPNGFFRRHWLILLVLATVATAPVFGAGLEIRGRVQLGAAERLGETGEPFPGAHVELFPVLTDYDEALELFRGERSPGEPRAAAVTRSDAHGSFVLRAPSPGLWRLQVSAPGFVAMESLLALTENLDVEPVFLVPASTQLLRVFGEGGEGTGDYRDSMTAWAIARSAEDGDRSRSPGSSPKTWHPVRSRVWMKVEDGVVRIPRAFGEDLEVRVWAPGYAPRTVRLPAEEPNPSLRLRSEPLRVVRLRVLDPYAVDAIPGPPVATAGPVADALVLRGTGVAGATGSRQQPFPLAQTDSEGRAEVLIPRDEGALLTLLSADGRRSIRPFKPGEGPLREAALKAEGGVVEWTLPPPVSVVGSALDEVTGEPVSGALVWFESVPSGWVQTDSQGLYHLAAPSKGKLVLRAEAAGYRGVEIPGRLEGDSLRGGPDAAGEEMHEGPLVSLTPVVALTGRVVDEAGEPVSGAEIRARASGETPGRPPYPADPVETGPNGVFRFAELTPALPYRLTARAEGFAPAEVDVPPLEHGTQAARSQPVVIGLERGRTAYGTVVDESDEPVPGARVALLGHAGTEARKRFLAGRRLAEKVQIFKDRTGQDGSFTIVDLPAGHLELVVQAEGFAPYEEPGVELVPEEPSKDLGRVELSPGLTLEGRVTDRHARPVVGAEVVELLRLRQGRAKLAVARTRTDADGRFRLEHLTKDMVFDLHVRHPDYSTEVLPNVAAADQELLRVELELPAVVTGRVLSSTGKPVARAWVGAKPPDAVDSWVLYSDRHGVDPTTHTDAEGRFRLPDVEPGRVRLSVEARGFQPYTRSGLEIFPATETEVKVVLEPGATVSGRVLDADGRPLSGVSVQGAGRNDRTDVQGHFRLVGISPGTHHLLAWSDQHGRIRRTVEVPAQGTVVELVFPAGRPVTGQVVGSEDQPVPGALVRLEPATEKTGTEGSARNGLTDRSGAFRFSQVPPGTYRLLARRDGLTMGSTAPVVEVASVPVRDLRLTLRPGGSVVGRVLGLEPGEAANLVVEARGPGPVRRGQVAGPGSYRIEGLRVGDWLVTAKVSGTGRRAQGRVRLREGDGETRLDLELGEGVSVTGRARENGEPLVDAEVHVFGPTGVRVASVRTDRSGSFRVEGLEPGTYGLELVSFGRQIRHAETLTIERDRRLEIDLATGSLSGRIVDAAGAPIARASLLLEPLAGPAKKSAPRWLTTEADGSFSAARLLAGRYQVTVLRPNGPGAGPKTPRVEVAVPAGSGVEGWVLELPPSR